MLLELMDAGEVLSVTELAKRLGTTPEMVTARLERYEQLGYIRKTVFSAGGAGGVCRGCASGKCPGCGGGKNGKSENGAPAAVYWERIRRP